MVIFSCQEPISRGKSIFALIRIFYETKEVDILVTPGLGDISINQFSQSVVLLQCEVSQPLPRVYPGGIFHGTRPH